MACRLCAIGAFAAAFLALSSPGTAAEPETLLYARYLDQRHARDGLEALADAGREAGLALKAGAYLTRPLGKLSVRKWSPRSATAAAVIDGLTGVLTRSPGKTQECPDWEEQPLTLEACPGGRDAYLALAALGVPKATVMRIRNSFPWWYSGYSADQAAIIVVIAPGQMNDLVARLRQTQVVDLIGYTIPAYRLEEAERVLPPR